jgi:hypothetical protein
VAGRAHITPAAQMFAAAAAVGTPSHGITCRVAGAGHLGLFMGRDALREDWPPLLAAVLKRSIPGRATSAGHRRR